MFLVTYKWSHTRSTPTIISCFLQVSKFQNWASTQVRQHVLAVKPQTVEEVKAVVKAAKGLGLRVRAVGSGHSWSPLFADEGHVSMYMTGLKRPDGPRMELIQVTILMNQENCLIPYGRIAPYIEI